MVLGIIPARGGSKDVKRKNLQQVAGRTLLSYTAEAALASNSIQRVVLSSEDEEILEIGKSLGLETPFVRPKELADDDTPTLPVLNHALDTLWDIEQYRPDIVVTLQPTSPLRTQYHIDKSLEMFIGSNADSLVSVVKVPHAYNPTNVFQVEGGFAKHYLSDYKPFQPSRRQNLPSLFARNGPAILITRSVILLDNGSLYGENIMTFEMERECSLDIDEYFDLELAEYLLSGNRRK